MNYKKVFWGIILVFIGLLFILRNMDIFHFSWFQFLNLWPLLIVLWGISILPIKGLIKLVLSLAVVVTGVFLIHRYDKRDWIDFRFPWYEKHYRDDSRSDSWRNRDKDSAGKEREEKSQYLFFPYSPEIQNATLKLDAAAGTFKLKEITTELIEVNKEGNIGSYSLTSHETGDSYVVDLSLEEATIRGERITHQVDIKLSELPIWKMDMNIGAARIDLDLSPFKTKNIEIDGGASSIRLKLGDRHPDTRIEIDAGASSIVIEVPINSGCRVQTNTVLSGRDMKDFRKTSSDNFITENYEDSLNKITIIVDVAVSKIEVKRY